MNEKELKVSKKDRQSVSFLRAVGWNSQECMKVLLGGFSQKTYPKLAGCWE